MISPKQTPLGVNAQASLLQNIGLTINPIASSYMGVSKVNASYTPGTVVSNTCLNLLTYAINDAYVRGVVTATPAGSSVYDTLISIGANVCPALGNAKPPTYAAVDPSSKWTDAGTPATTGYANDVNPDYPNNDEGQGQEASWLPYDTTNPNSSVTQWGFIRNYALQAWNEFNWNGIPNDSSMPQYKDFTGSFMAGQGFIDLTNVSINAVAASSTFLKGTYSNMNDLTSADITGVNLATFEFGQDCIIAGKVIDLSKLARFGLPSVLLQTIKKYNAMSQSLTLALLSAGLTPDEVTSIATGGTATTNQEQQIYGAFLVIVGFDLTDVLVPLNCKTKGLTTLADLLDIRKLFPNSYLSMTVPVYNTTSGPTNSKTYYPIYENNGVSPRLIGPIIEKQFPGGFGSYTRDVIPEDIAVSAGAFAMSMQQINNIKSVQFEKFAQVAASMEVVTKDLPLTVGTDVPVNTTLASQGQNILALGSGPNGGYTDSDLFGCMSGLPYSWNELQSDIQLAQTTKLSNIYNQLYLSTTWEYATVSVQYSTGSGPSYTVTGVTITDPGGGYGRGTATAPTITISGGSGATATCTIGTDPTDITNFGRVTSVTLTSAGVASGTIPTITIQSPPIDTLAVTAGGDIATGGTNTTAAYAGWPTMNTVVSAYITQANTEIDTINSLKPSIVSNLNTVYNAAGRQLMIEQRSRYTAFPPVSTPRDTWINQYPVNAAIFTDSIGTYAKFTYPHMYAQTLEAISDLNTVGGQSIVALMRQERNAARLQELGISLDNNLPDKIDENMCPVLISNGTVPIGVTGIDVTGINGDAADPITTYTVPAVLLQETTGALNPKPHGYFDPNTNDYIRTNKTLTPDQTSPIQNIINASNSTPNNRNMLGPMGDGTGPALPITTYTVDPLSLQTGSTETSPGSSNVIQTQPIVIVKSGSAVSTGDGIPLDIGKPEFPGSLAGSGAMGTVPCTLNSAYTSSVLLPSTLSVDEAIADVIKCNCDCWVD